MSNRLLGDIGGTHARFAWQADAGAPLCHVATLHCKDYASVQDAIHAYLSTHSLEAPKHCALGIAYPVAGDAVKMTNHHWSFSIAALRESLGFERLLVLNDFTALALSLPTLTSADLHPLGTGRAIVGAPIAVIGPGTGLGVSGLLFSGAQPVAIQGEGGHVSLPASNALEAAVVELLQQRYGHASAERALSGPGLVNLYHATCTLEQAHLHPYQAAEVVAFGRTGENPQCARALDLFFSFLGNVAGNLALTLGSSGGVYIGGGIVPRLTKEIERSTFRQAFEGKGRFSNYLRPIPTWIITAFATPALLGAANALNQDSGLPNKAS